MSGTVDINDLFEKVCNVFCSGLAIFLHSSARSHWVAGRNGLCQQGLRT